MAVYRVVPAEDAAHRDLGCVEVTIDDLDALITFLTRDKCEFTIEFDGGSTFTEPKDLLDLSPAERESFRLKTPKVEVVLNSSAARAIGERQEVENVYRVWAEKRQTRRSPRPVWWADVTVLAFAVMAWFVIIFGVPRLFLHIKPLRACLIWPWRVSCSR